jgi:hypothetical protein
MSDDEWLSRYAQFLGTPVEQVDREQAILTRAVFEPRQIEKEKIFAEWLDGDVEHLFGIGVPPEHVRDYRRQESRILTNLYFKAREPVPSPDDLRRLAFQYALDARLPVEGNLARFGWQKLQRRWAVGQYPDPAARSQGLSPPLGYRTIHGWYHNYVLEKVITTRIDRDSLIDVIEAILGGRPAESWLSETAGPSAFEYDITADGVVKLWIWGSPVTKIDGINVQRLLRYFCDNPDAHPSGRSLEATGPKIKNVSSAAERLRSRLKAANTMAEGWFTTKPLGWAKGCSPRRRLKTPSSPQA